MFEFQDQPTCIKNKLRSCIHIKMLPDSPIWTRYHCTL